MLVRNSENFSYNPNCLIVRIGGCGGWKGGWVSFMFWQIFQSISFCYVRFLHGFDKKDLVSFVYYNTSGIAKPKVDCRNSECWYSFKFLYFYGLFLICKSQKRKQKFCSYTCSNLFTRNPHTPQRLLFNYFVFSTSLFQPFNLITVTKSATLDSKFDKRHFEYGKSII